MELRQLTYFLTVCDTLHFGKAADSLHIAQQPLSYQIKRLEDELGYKLFERTTRLVTLTPAGELFRKKVHEAIKLIEQGKNDAGRIARGEAGKIVIGYNSMTLHNIFPSVVSEFRSRHPDVEVVLHERNSPELEMSIVNEEVDVGIVPIYTPGTDKLTYEAVFSESAILALPKNHRLSMKKSIRLAELSKEPLLIYSRNVQATAYDHIIALCYRTGFSPNIIQEAENPMALLGLVSAGLGVAIVSRGYHNILNEFIDYRPIEDNGIDIDITVVWKNDKYTPLIADLLSIARENNFSF